MTTTKKAKDKQKTTCQETRNSGRIEKKVRGKVVKGTE